MLPQKQLKKLMKLLGVKKESNAVFFTARMEGWLNKNGVSKTSIMKGLNLVLEQIHKKEIKEAQEAKKINLNGVKNKLIIKYSKEIVELNNQGWGDYKISKYLMQEHKAKISRSSIYRFLKLQLQNKENK